MAGRKKHVKKTFTARSADSYKNKLAGILSVYNGVEKANEWVDKMYDNYSAVFEDYYNAVHKDPIVQTTIQNHFASGLRFVAYQIINQTIYDVLLTKSTTFTQLVDKYQNQGIQPEITTALVYAVTLKMMQLNSRVASEISATLATLGYTEITPSKIGEVLNNYVKRSFPLPASYAGTFGKEVAIMPPVIYAGGAGFMPYSEVSTATRRIVGTATTEMRRAVEAI